MRGALGAIALVIALQAGAWAMPSKPPSVILSIGPQDKAGQLVAELTRQMQASRRFVIPPPVAFLGLDQPLTAVIPKLRKYARADWAFIASLDLPDPASDSARSTPNGGSEPRREAPPRSMTLVGRMIDLNLGDSSKDLRFTGPANDVAGLARDLTRFFKSLTPLRGEVTGVWDNRVLINVGAEDGVEVGSLYSLKIATPSGDHVLGSARIVSADPWFCAGEIVSRRQGTRIQAGAIAVEDLGYAFLR